MNGAVYEAPNAEYRTEIEVVCAHPRDRRASTNGPAYFTVEAADGRIYEVRRARTTRASTDRRVRPRTARAAGRSTASATVAGNVIDYRYAEESGSTAFRIANIQYNANPGNGIAASHQVAFTYEQRPEPGDRLRLRRRHAGTRSHAPRIASTCSYGRLGSATL